MAAALSTAVGAGRTGALVAVVSATVVGGVSGNAAILSCWEQPTAIPRANIAEMTNPLNTLPLQLNILMELALHCVSRLTGEI